MTTTSPNPYLRTKVMTASPAELRLMLFDGAIKYLEQGKEGLENQDYEASYNGISRCQNIIMELVNSLQPQHAPELCEKLSGLYTFMYTRLVKACTERDAKMAEEVLELLRYERSTWSMLMTNLAKENASGAEAASSVAKEAAKAPKPAEGGATPEEIIGGQLSVQG